LFTRIPAALIFHSCRGTPSRLSEREEYEQHDCGANHSYDEAVEIQCRKARTAQAEHQHTYDGTGDSKDKVADEARNQT